MSQIGYLEALSDKELRAKCVEYGLPNIPVTDSSRKLLIRRLLAVFGEPVEKKTKPRTTAPKVSASLSLASDAHKKEVPSKINEVQGQALRKDNDLHQYTPPNPRSTGSLSKTRLVTTNFDRNESIPSHEYLQYRDTNYDLHQYTPSKPRPGVSLSKTSLLRTNFDTNELIPSYEKLQHSDTNVAFDRSPSIPRSDRSVSLSRSEVITTSYMQELAPSASWEEDEEMDVDLEEEDNIYNSTAYDDRTQGNFRTSVGDSTSNRNNPSKDETEEHFSDNIMNTSSFNSSLDAASSTNRLYPSLPRIEHTDFPEPMYVTQRRTNPQTHTSTYPQQLSRESDRRDKSNIHNYRNNASSLQSNFEYDDDLPHTTFQRANTTANKVMVDRGAAFGLLDDTDNVDNDYMGKEEKPYTSKFARNLESHKKQSPSQHRSTIHASKQENNPLVEHAVDLDRKYHLKQAFALIICFLLAVFVYVFFLQ